jgi:serine/threonine protein kinase
MGLSKRYMIEEDYHIPMKKGNQMVGTLRYASVSNHKGFEQSRRDDLESIGYVLVYFLMGSLPWQSIQAGSVKDKIEMIKNKKITIPLDKMCPSYSQLSKFIKYSRELKFD